MEGKVVGVTFGRTSEQEPYLEALRGAGIEPVSITPDLPRPLHGLDGLLISGGADLNPRLYKQQPKPETGTPDDPRDELEASLLGQALEQDLPVLCICRGMQLFNVIHGGTLHQHVEGHRRKGVNEAHRVEVAPGTSLAKILGPGSHPVNSRHHQTVDQVGGGLEVAARSDQVIEALERPGKRFALAVQWHPEDLVGIHEEARKLFLAFADALAKR